MEETREKFASWAILELMGHRRLAGYVQEQEFAGAGMVRIDVPSVPPVTQMYGVSAIYCLTPCTEQTAREVAGRCGPAPVHRWELPPALDSERGDAMNVENNDDDASEDVDPTDDNR